MWLLVLVYVPVDALVAAGGLYGWRGSDGSQGVSCIARAACGVGAGGIMTLGSIIVSDLVPIERRGAYQSYLNIVYGIGSTLGAALGGFMADYLGWRW